MDRPPHMCIILARSGSERLENKNIRQVIPGVGLLEWAVSQACYSELFDFLIVSSDSQSYLNAAKTVVPQLVRRTDDIDLGHIPTVYYHHRSAQNATSIATSADAIEEAIAHYDFKHLEPYTLFLWQVTTPFHHRASIKSLQEECEERLDTPGFMATLTAHAGQACGAGYCQVRSADADFGKPSCGVTVRTHRFWELLDIDTEEELLDAQWTLGQDDVHQRLKDQGYLVQ